MGMSVSSVCEVCAEMSDKTFSNEMGTFDKRICNIEDAVSSIPRTHVTVDDFLASLPNLEMNPDSQHQINDDIANVVREIRHDLNTVMESLYAANAQHVCTPDERNQFDHVNDQDVIYVEEGSTHPAAAKPASDTYNKRKPTPFSQSYYSKDRRLVT